MPSGIDRALSRREGMPKSSMFIAIPSILRRRVNGQYAEARNEPIVRRGRRH